MEDVLNMALSSAHLDLTFKTGCEVEQAVVVATGGRVEHRIPVLTMEDCREAIRRITSGEFQAEHEKIMGTQNGRDYLAGHYQYDFNIASQTEQLGIIRSSVVKLMQEIMRRRHGEDQSNEITEEPAVVQAKTNQRGYLRRIFDYCKQTAAS